MESGGGYSGVGRDWVPQVLCQNNIISHGSYGRDRAGRGNRGEPFPVEFQVPKRVFMDRLIEVLRLRQPIGLAQVQPSQCSNPHLRVGLEVSERVLPGVPRKTEGTGVGSPK
ncbi:hypothetical protein GOBAR_AA27992 [Gossypium barbadense]|uniref:Uncharacterized protein n=1 Tax=Gossypium barbadense TaxID=3634 RepID=A0A2P5WNT0_GOSBA|nr:hypothetical protein GOBAR_AA27992 [Gossypium barbadense]